MTSQKAFTSHFHEPPGSMCHCHYSRCECSQSILSCNSSNAVVDPRLSICSIWQVHPHLFVISTRYDTRQTSADCAVSMLGPIYSMGSD